MLTITKELLDDCLKNQKFINLKTSELTTDHPSTWSPVKGLNKRNKTLLKQIYQLYIQGDMHPTVYCEIFGLNPHSIRGALKQAGPLMDRKTSLKVYGDQTLKMRESTMKDLYGVSNASQSLELRAKAQNTNLKIYGTIHASQSGTIKERVKQNNLERYGVESPTQTDEVQAKRKFTNLIKYGTPEIFQSDEFKQKRKTALEINPIRKLSPEGMQERESNEMERKSRSTRP